MTIKQVIIKLLEEKNIWVWGGQIDREVHGITGAKESVVSRRCRELARAGVLEAEYAQIDGAGPRCVRYRITPENRAKGRILLNSPYKPETLWKKVVQERVKPIL